MARALAISDVHGNLAALRAVLSAARGWDELIVLGDLVDYGPRPAEVIDELRGLGARIIMGNHDNAVAYGVDCRCGEETHWLSVWFRENVTLKLVSGEDRDFLRGLPERLELDAGPVKVVAVHGAPRNPLYAYLNPWLSDDEVCAMLRRPLRLREAEAAGCPQGLFLVGHTHRQFYRAVRGSAVANPGGLGQPRDGDARAPYMILDLDGPSVTLGRVRYDVDKVIRDLEALGVPEPYMGALWYMLYYASTPPRPSA